ncbi:MAG TPA: type IV-A pilus assembly ATPase PilB, partial [Gammaproteobacteria bacterium]
MASSASSIKLNGLSKRLVSDGLLEENAALQAQLDARKKKISLAACLAEDYKINTRKIAVASSEEFGLPLLDLAALDTESIPRNLIEEKLIRQHQALPILKRGNRLFVAVADPMNLMALDEIKFNTGIPTEPVLVEVDKLNRLIEDALSAADTAMEDMAGLDEDLENLDISSEEEGESDDAASGVDDTPV